MVTGQMVSGDCQCRACVSRCSAYPGWMMPDEAARAIEAGRAMDLMLDWFCPDENIGNKEDIFVLVPASVGRRGQRAPLLGFEALFGKMNEPCTLLKDGLCTIHDSGFKPRQCRTVFACRGLGDDKYAIVPAWRAPEALALVERWKSLVGFEDER